MQQDESNYSRLQRAEIPYVIQLSKLHGSRPKKKRCYESTELIDEDEESLEEKRRQQNEPGLNAHFKANKDNICTTKTNNPGNEIDQRNMEVDIRHKTSDEISKYDSVDEHDSIDDGSDAAEWAKFYEQLLLYNEQYGHCKVPRTFKVNKALAQWVIHQRREQNMRACNKPTSMTAERFEKLDKIGFYWNKDYEDRWNQRHEELVKFHGIHGHCRVPRGDEKYKDLGRWVNHQKLEYKRRCEGKPNQLTLERFVALQKIGFEWSLDHDSKWQQKFNELLEFRLQYGHTNVPFEYKENKQLATWVYNQRVLIRKKQEGNQVHFPVEHIAALENIGFDWGLGYCSKWDKKFAELKEFKQRYGHCNVSRRDTEYAQLRVWVTTQKFEYGKKCAGKASCISDDRIKALESIGFDWGSRLCLKWQERYDELKDFKQEFGHCNVTPGNERHQKLRVWIYNQRREYKKKLREKPSQMSSERIKALENIGFVWNMDYDTKWQQRFQELVEFNKKHGHMKVPLDKKNKQLGQWVKHQKYQYRKKSLGKESFITDERVAALEKIGFPIDGYDQD